MNRIPMLFLIQFVSALAQPPRPFRQHQSFRWLRLVLSNRLEQLHQVGLFGIQGCVNARAEIGYHVIPQLSLRVGAEYVHGSSKGSYSVTGDMGPTLIATVEESASITSFPVDLGV
jgi:hypothetical protein